MVLRYEALTYLLIFCIKIILRLPNSSLWFFHQEPPSEYVQPRVSPYRLAAHLTSAFAIYCGLFWTALSVVMPEPPAESVAWVRGAAKVKRLALPVSIVVGITAVSGAFVAGNDAVCYYCFSSFSFLSICSNADSFCFKSYIHI